MVYEKKVEPLRKHELWLAGIFLQIFIIFLGGLPWIEWSAGCVNIIFDADIESSEDLQSVHQCIKDHKSDLLFGCTLVLLGYPIIICHAYYNYRTWSLMAYWMNFNFLYAIQMASWMIVSVVYCIIVPGLLIFVAYYDWELMESFEYVGYAMQFQFLHLSLILIDCCYIPLAIATSGPWICLLVYILGMKCTQSSHYKLDGENMVKSLGAVYCGASYIMAPNCKTCTKWTTVIWALTLVVITLFGAFGDVFDYDKEGFFSYDGGSQFLKVVMFAMWQIQAIDLFMFACRFDTFFEIIENNVTKLEIAGNQY